MNLAVVMNQKWEEKSDFSNSRILSLFKKPSPLRLEKIRN